MFAYDVVDDLLRPKPNLRSRTGSTTDTATGFDPRVYSRLLKLRIFPTFRISDNVPDFLKPTQLEYSQNSIENRT